MSLITRHISIIEDITKRAHARPCTIEELQRLEVEMKQSIASLRQEREVMRERMIIEPEPPELRKAMHAAEATIREAMVEHEVARMELSRVLVATKTRTIEVRKLRKLWGSRWRRVMGLELSINLRI